VLAHITSAVESTTASTFALSGDAPLSGIPTKFPPPIFGAGVGTGGTGVGTGVGGEEEVTTAPTSTESAPQPPAGAAAPALCISLARSIVKALAVDPSVRVAVALVATVSDTPVIV